MTTTLQNTVEGHQFMTGSVPLRGGAFTRLAACSCGQGYEWATREEQHEQHVLAVVWEQGWAAAWSPMSMHGLHDGPNPYKGES